MSQSRLGLGKTDDTLDELSSLMQTVAPYPNQFSWNPVHCETNCRSFHIFTVCISSLTIIVGFIFSFACSWFPNAVAERWSFTYLQTPARNWSTSPGLIVRARSIISHNSC